MSYYEGSQWPTTGQANWEHQTPPTRSGANSAIPREESAAFVYQLEEVDRAIDNLAKSGKMFGMPGGRRESHLHQHPRHGGPARPSPDFDARMGPNSRSHGDFGDSRGGGSGGHNPSSNLQNFYASQRHQSSRGSNEAEQMMQAKRRMAAQRERELRNYHQEQQYNRTVLSDLSYSSGSAGGPGSAGKSDRALSPAASSLMSEDERRELIARQRSALYGEGAFAETGGYVDETGTTRPGAPHPHDHQHHLRNNSPHAYDYRGDGSGIGSGNNEQRSSNASPQSNPGASGGPPQQQQPSRTSASSPGGSPPRGGNAPAPIGTRPAGAATSAANANSSGNSGNNSGGGGKRSTTPLPSPLSQSHSVAGEEKPNAGSASGQQTADGQGGSSPSVGLSGWGSRSGVWGNKSGLGVQASVWG